MQIPTFVCKDFLNLLTVKMRTIVVFIGAISLPKYTCIIYIFAVFFRRILRDIAIRPKNKAYSQEVNPIVELSDIYQKKSRKSSFSTFFGTTIFFVTNINVCVNEIWHVNHKFSSLLWLIVCFIVCQHKKLIF